MLSIIVNLIVKSDRINFKQFKKNVWIKKNQRYYVSLKYQIAKF